MLKKCWKKFEKLMKKDWKIAESAGAGAKGDHFKLGVRTRVRADLNLDVRGACVQPKKRSQLTPCKVISLLQVSSHKFEPELWLSLWLWPLNNHEMKKWYPRDLCEEICNVIIMSVILCTIQTSVYHPKVLVHNNLLKMQVYW